MIDLCGASCPIYRPYRLLPLTRMQYALVDSIDYKWLCLWKWQANWSKLTKSFYAKRAGGILLHRQLLGLEKGNKLKGDHRNLISLDNRRVNLRRATHRDNVRNTGLRENNTSGFRGVHLHKYSKKWKAQINCDGSKIHLGLFSTKEAAFEAYRFACIALFGEFAYEEAA